VNEAFLDLVFKMPVAISDRVMLRIANLVRRRDCEIKGIVIHDGLIQVVASHSKTARTVVLSFDRDGNVKGSESFRVSIGGFSSFVHSDDIAKNESESGRTLQWDGVINHPRTSPRSFRTGHVRGVRNAPG